MPSFYMQLGKQSKVLLTLETASDRGSLLLINYALKLPIWDTTVPYDHLSCGRRLSPFNRPSKRMKLSIAKHPGIPNGSGVCHDKRQQQHAHRSRKQYFLPKSTRFGGALSEDATGSDAP